MSLINHAGYHTVFTGYEYRMASAVHEVYHIGIQGKYPRQISLNRAMDQPLYTDRSTGLLNLPG
ncbi:MAG: hypothetical protein AB1611_21045 [bacterium]